MKLLMKGLKIILAIIIWPVGISWLIWRTKWAIGIRIGVIATFWIAVIGTAAYLDADSENYVPPTQVAEQTETKETRQKSANSDNQPVQSESSTNSVVETDSSEQQALSLVQSYTFKTDKTIADRTVKAGTTLKKYFEDELSLGVATDGSWSIEKHDDTGYLVQYSRKVGSLDPVGPRWRVDGETIITDNGIASSFTPELKVEQDTSLKGSEQEKAIYEDFDRRYDAYEEAIFANDPFPSGQDLEDAENKALQETADKFGITADEVKDIFIRLDMERYGTAR